MTGCRLMKEGVRRKASHKEQMIRTLARVSLFESKELSVELLGVKAILFDKIIAGSGRKPDFTALQGGRSKRRRQCRKKGKENRGCSWRHAEGYGKSRRGRCKERANWSKEQERLAQSLVVKVKVEDGMKSLNPWSLLYMSGVGTKGL